VNGYASEDSATSGALLGRRGRPEAPAVAAHGPPFGLVREAVDRDRDQIEILDAPEAPGRNVFAKVFLATPSTHRQAGPERPLLDHHVAGSIGDRRALLQALAMMRRELRRVPFGFDQ
jgi:hypothetical protein